MYSLVFALLIASFILKNSIFKKLATGSVLLYKVFFSDIIILIFHSQWRLKHRPTLSCMLINKSSVCVCVFVYTEAWWKTKHSNQQCTNTHTHQCGFSGVPGCMNHWLNTSNYKYVLLYNLVMVLEPAFTGRCLTTLSHSSSVSVHAVLIHMHTITFFIA